jgi:hypothetical protein
MVRVLEDASAVTADITVARKAVEAVAMEATMAALCAMRNDPIMVSLEAVAMEASKVAMRELHDGIIARELCDGIIVHELRDGIVARQVSVEAQMYGDDAADEESRVATTAVVAVGTTAWLLIDGDETEVEDDDDNDVEVEAATEAQRDTELRAAEVRVKAAAEVECAAAAEAAKQAAHWAAEMDKALAYRRDIDRSTAAHRADTEHRIEQCIAVRRQEAAVALSKQPASAATATEAPCSRETAAVVPDT